MKTLLTRFAVAVVFAGCATHVLQSLDPVANTLLDKVVVEALDLDLDAPPENDDGHLWNAFVGKPYEGQFSELSTKNWFANCERFQARILSQAGAGGFDVESLRKALDGLQLRESDETARIPVGAFAARKGPDGVWIIVIKWECSRSYEKDGATRWPSLGHIEVIAVRIKDGKQVDSDRCF